MKVTIREVQVEETLDLRHRILRQGLPLEAARFEGDDVASTHHVAAFADTRIVGCATILFSSWVGEPAWQLRGMAVDDDYRGSGVGRRLIEALERIAQHSDTRLMWCNARKPAIGFYQKLGWQVVSDVFEVPTAGPHVKMIKRPTSDSL